MKCALCNREALCRQRLCERCLEVVVAKAQRAKAKQVSP